MGKIETEPASEGTGMARWSMIIRQGRDSIRGSIARRGPQAKERFRALEPHPAAGRQTKHRRKEGGEPDRRADRYAHAVRRHPKAAGASAVDRSAGGRHSASSRACSYIPGRRSGAGGMGGTGFARFGGRNWRAGTDCRRGRHGCRPLGAVRVRARTARRPGRDDLAGEAALFSHIQHQTKQDYPRHP